MKSLSSKHKAKHGFLVRAWFFSRIAHKNERFIIFDGYLLIMIEK